MKFISVDIGYNGGIVIFENDKIIEYQKMPIIKSKKGKKYKKDLDINAILNIFKQHLPKYVFIENIHAMPFMNIQSMFRFGEQLGIIKTIATMYAEKYILIDIKSWKKYFGLLKTKKEESVKLVNKKFNLNLKKSDDGIADAILIGLFGYYTFCDIK